MGTNTCIEEKSSLLTTFDPKQWIAISHYPSQIWENQRTGIKATVHVLLSISQIQKYQYRHLHPNYLLSIINVVPPKGGICNFEESPFLLMLEYVVVKFKQIEFLSYPEAYYALKCALRGYGILSCFYGPLYTNEQLIMVNQYGNVKVWINEDLTQNQPSIKTCIRNQKYSTKPKINQKIKKSILKIVSVVQKKCERDFPYKFKEQIDKFENYEQAADFIERFVNFEGLQQIDKIDISRYVQKFEQQHKNQRSSRASSNISSSQSFLKYQVSKIMQPRNKEQIIRGNNFDRNIVINHDKSNTPQSKVQKKSVKSYRDSKKVSPVNCNTIKKKQQNHIHTIHDNKPFQKFFQIEQPQHIIPKEKQRDKSNKIRIQYSSPSPQPTRVCQYSPVSNTSTSYQNRTNSPIYFNHNQIKDLGQSSNTDKTFPSSNYTVKHLTPSQSKTNIASKRPNIAKVPLTQQQSAYRYPPNPQIRYIQNHNQKSPRIVYQDTDNYFDEQQGISLTQIPQQKNSYKFSSDLDSFINNSMNSNHIDPLKLKSDSNKHIRTQSNKPQLKQFSKIKQYIKGGQSNNFQGPRAKPTYSIGGQRQQLQTDNIISQKDFINEISFKNIQKPQKIVNKSALSMNNPYIQQSNNSNVESYFNQDRINQDNSKFGKQKRGVIKQFLLASMEKSQKHKKEMERFRQQLEQHEHLYEEPNNCNQMFGVLSKQMQRRHGYVQSLSLSELQSELSDLLRSSTQFSQQSQIINISMKNQNPQANSRMKKKHRTNSNVLKDVLQ